MNHIFGRRVNHIDIANAAFGIEQGMRALDRYHSPTCTEHGFKLSRCKELGLYHANGKVHHHVFMGLCVNNCRRV